MALLLEQGDPQRFFQRCGGQGAGDLGEVRIHQSVRSNARLRFVVDRLASELTSRLVR